MTPPLTTLLVILINAARNNGACDREISELLAVPESPIDFDMIITLDDAKHLPKSPFWACWYAKNVIKGRWPEAEFVIKNDSRFSYIYARDALNGRFNAAENNIKNDPQYAYLYARNILKTRWPIAENAIMTNAKYSFLYSIWVLDERWPEAESIISTNSSYWDTYSDNYLNG